MQRTESGKGGRGRKVFQKKKKRGGKGKRKGRMLLSCVTFVCLSLLSHFLSGYCGCCCFSLCAFSLSHTHTFAFILDFVVYPVCVRLSVCLFVSFSLSLSYSNCALCFFQASSEGRGQSHPLSKANSRIRCCGSHRRNTHFKEGKRT